MARMELISLLVEVESLKAALAEANRQVCRWIPGTLQYDACHAADQQEIARLRQALEQHERNEVRCR